MRLMTGELSAGSLYVRVTSPRICFTLPRFSARFESGSGGPNILGWTSGGFWHPTARRPTARFLGQRRAEARGMVDGTRQRHRAVRRDVEDNSARCREITKLAQ